MRSELNYDRSNIRTKIKSIIGRNFSGIDTVINDLINIAVELFGNTVQSVYDEFVYTHIQLQVEKYLQRQMNIIYLTEQK